MANPNHTLSAMLRGPHPGSQWVGLGNEIKSGVGYIVRVAALISILLHSRKASSKPIPSRRSGIVQVPCISVVGSELIGNKLCSFNCYPSLMRALCVEFAGFSISMLGVGATAAPPAASFRACVCRYAATPLPKKA